MLINFGTRILKWAVIVEELLLSLFDEEELLLTLLDPEVVKDVEVEGEDRES